MSTVNVTLGSDTQLNLPLGRQLENAVTSVVFDFSAWNTAYGSGTLSLSVLRPGDTTPYAVTLTVNSTNATWSVSSIDTAYEGIGEIQLTYKVGTAVKKSVKYKFTVYGSLGANGEYPSPGQTWQENIEDDISDIKSDLDDISTSTRNLWTFGNQTFTEIKQIAFDLPAGTYTLSAIPTSSDVQATVCRVRISSTNPLTGGTGIIANFNLNRNVRNSYTFTTTVDGKIIEFSASNTNSSSIGDTATFANIQIESGEYMKWLDKNYGKR